MSDQQTYLNGKSVGIRGRKLCAPKETKMHQAPRLQHERFVSRNAAFLGSRPTSTTANRTFRRSPHLQAVIDRVERRRKMEKDKGGRNRNRNRENKGCEEVDGATALSQRILKGLSTLRRYRTEREELELDDTAVSNLVAALVDVDDYPSRSQVENPPLNFRKNNPLMQFGNPKHFRGDRQASGIRSTFPLRNAKRLSSYSTRREKLVADEVEVTDTFRPRGKKKFNLSSIKISEDNRDGKTSRAENIRQLREHRRDRLEKRRKRRQESREKSNEQELQEERKSRDASEVRYAEGGDISILGEPRRREHYRRTAGGGEVLETEDKIKKKSTKAKAQEGVCKEMDGMFCMWPAGPTEQPSPPPSRRRGARPELVEHQPPPSPHMVTSDTQLGSDESDKDSFGPAEEARRLKKRLKKLHRLSKEMRESQEEMRGEMIQLQNCFKKRRSQLKEDFARNSVTVHHQGEARDAGTCESSKTMRASNHCRTNFGGEAYYEIRDGVIVLDDVQEIGECETPGAVQNDAQHRPQLGDDPRVQRPEAVDPYRTRGGGGIVEDRRARVRQRQPLLETTEPSADDRRARDDADAPRVYDQRHAGEVKLPAHWHKYRRTRYDEDCCYTDKGGGERAGDGDDVSSVDSIDLYQRRGAPLWNYAPPR